MQNCKICPRNCGVNRIDGQVGVCNQTVEIRVARAALHYWEEPCISGRNGSGAVFFYGCNLGCIFCQNYEIAHKKTDVANPLERKELSYVSVERLAEIFLELQEKHANNINLVTPTHYALQIAQAIEISKKQGLKIPVVYNTSAYEKIDTLKRLDGLVDIYLPDFKYMDSDKAANYSRAKDYPEIAKAAIAEMYRQVGHAKFTEEAVIEEVITEDAITKVVITEEAIEEAITEDKHLKSTVSEKFMDAECVPNKVLTKGMIVRHMVLPLGVKNAKQVISYLYETYQDDIYISIMNQYTPPNLLYKSENINDLQERIVQEASKKNGGNNGLSYKGFQYKELPYKELNRKVTKREYENVVEFALSLGIKNAFIQEGETAKESFLPLFNGEGIWK